MRLRLISMIRAGLVCLLLAGCSSIPRQAAVQWTKFEGDQEVWPTQEMGLMHARDGFPIYHLSQCPPDAYEVLGYIQAAAYPAGDTTGDERAVVQMAQQHGGDAVLISRQNPPSQLSPASQTDYLVIKFKPRTLATAIENIDIFLALTAGITNDYSGFNHRGVKVHLSAPELAAERQELIKLKENLLASPEFQHRAP